MNDLQNVLANVIRDPVFVKDSESKLIFVNDAFCELFGLNRDQIMGKTLAEQVPEEERESFLAIDKNVIETGNENVNEESLTILGKPTKYISTRKSCYIDSNGKRFLIGIIRDITERVINEMELKQREAQLLELNNTKDKLFSIIAHDIRSPFSNIIGLSDYIEGDISDLSFNEILSYTKKINVSAKHSLNLLDNLLLWAKSQTGLLIVDAQNIDLKKTLELVVNGVVFSAERKQIKLVLNYKTEIKSFKTDEILLRTIVRNLLTNAVKFTPKGGQVTIEVDIHNKNQLELSVIDNGVGMDKAKLRNLFSIDNSKVSRGTANEKGSGLGLHLCKEFTDKLQGKIQVDSELGVGTKFKLTLPNYITSQ